MAKPEWGTKRLCQSCGAKFYDMARSPIVCPKCSATFDVDAAVKLKRGRSAPQEPKPKEKPTLEEADAETSEDAPALDTGETDEEGAAAAKTVAKQPEGNLKDGLCEPVGAQ